MKPLWILRSFGLLAGIGMFLGGASLYEKARSFNVGSIHTSGTVEQSVYRVRRSVLSDGTDFFFCDLTIRYRPTPASGPFTVKNSVRVGSAGAIMASPGPGPNVCDQKLASSVPLEYLPGDPLNITFSGSKSELWPRALETSGGVATLLVFLTILLGRIRRVEPSHP